MSIQPEWATVVITLLLGLIAAYLGHNYRRQVRLTLADHRLEAYSKLWELTGLAAPTRLDERTGLVAVDQPLSGSLSDGERTRLYSEMTTWYYRDGNGMLLGSQTRDLYLKAKHNLVCADGELEPERFRALLLKHELMGNGTNLSEAERGCYSIRQLSLLRSQMKADLAIYGVPFFGALQDHEKAFLQGCGVNLLRRPWRRAIGGRIWGLLSRLRTPSGSAEPHDTAGDQVKQCREPSS